MTSFYKVLFFIVDILLLNFSILSGYLLFDSNSMGAEMAGVVYLLIYSSLSWLFLVMVSAPYSVTKNWTVSRIVKNQMAFIFIHLLVVASLIVFFRHEYTLLQIVSIYAFFIPLFFISKVAVYYLRRVFGNEVVFRYFILIGKNSLAFEIRKHYLINQELGYKFKGYIDYNTSIFPLLQIQEFCIREEVNEIYCCAPELPANQLKQLIDFGLDSLIKVKVISGSSSSFIQLDKSNRLIDLNETTIPIDASLNQFIKRVFDILFSSLFFVLIMSWLLPIISVLIKLDSKGPVFFKQLRSGKDNKPFICLKFRTMIVNVESDTKQATKDDPRITKLGNFLRKSSIDELPQFFNVFMGSMSVVGPRPHMLKHTEEYSKLIESFMGRHYVKPGVTGLAQSLGYRGETKTKTDMENRVRLDRYYIENWTFWLDIKIIFLTVVSLIRGSDKAY